MVFYQRNGGSVNSVQIQALKNGDYLYSTEIQNILEKTKQEIIKLFESKLLELNEQFKAL